MEGPPKMKIYLFIAAICISVCSSAQTKWYKEGQGFESCFQKLEKGNFNGSIVGILQLEYKNGDNFTSTFSNDTAQLCIVPDPNNIYDVSYKNYKAKSNNLQLQYSTYAYANAIEITMGSRSYYLSLFDGACIGVINGLDYEYISNNNTELLTIHFSNDVGLCATKCYTDPELFIKKGSTLIFSLKKN